jgi:hypothetical protein
MGNRETGLVAVLVLAVVGCGTCGTGRDRGDPKSVDAEHGGVGASAAPNDARDSGVARTGRDLLGAFVATLYTNNPGNATPGLNHDPEDAFYFGGTVSPHVWVSNETFDRCDFAASIDEAPGVGNRWTFSAEFAPLATDQSCGDVREWSAVPLCTLGADEKSCSAESVAMALTGPFCLRGKGVGSRGGAAFRSRGGGTAALHCRKTGTQGSIHFQGSGGSPLSTRFYAGNVVRNTQMDRAFWPSPGAALDSCSGVVALRDAPGSGTWHVEIATSKAALSAGQSCADLSYDEPVAACTISDANKQCHFPQTPAPVVAGGCVQLQGRCTGSCGATRGGPNYGLDCRIAASSALAGGGLAYGSAGSGAFDDCDHCFDTGEWAISDAAAAPAARLGQQYWRAPASGLAGCAAAFTFDAPPSGSGQYQLHLRRSTTAPRAGQGCLDLSYEDSAVLCTLGSGDKSCSFPYRAFEIAPGACFALYATKRAGTPAGTSGNQFNWQAICLAR